jgi:hypothetical protein
MAIPNIFKLDESDQIIERINKLNINSTPVWGKMNVAQMLAHCNITYEMVYSNKHKPAKGLGKLLLKLFVKNTVVNEQPYKKNSRTGPQFIITDEKNFDEEKTNLVNYISKTQKLGEAHFNGKESLSFGALSVAEWNNLFAKHVDHHLQQFGV